MRGTVFVAVDALQLHRPAVDEQAVASDALLLEADPTRADVVALPDDEGVEIWVLGRPESREGQLGG